MDHGKQVGKKNHALPPQEEGREVKAPNGARTENFPPERLRSPVSSSPADPAMAMPWALVSRLFLHS